MRVNRAWVLDPNEVAPTGSASVVWRPLSLSRGDVPGSRSRADPLVGSRDGLGTAPGQLARRHEWEARTYWQHVEQYALDPNLQDSDFFEGRGNLEGIFAAVGYGLTENVVVTFRYGYAGRINDALGTGGSNADLPQMNPIGRFSLMQLDLTVKF